MVEVLAILKTFSKQPLYVLLERAIESETSGRESRADEYTQLLRAKRRTSLVVSSLGRMARKEQKFLRLSLHGDNHSVSWSHPQGPAMRCGEKFTSVAPLQSLRMSRDFAESVELHEVSAGPFHGMFKAGTL